MRRVILFCGLTVALAATLAPPASGRQADDALVARARAIHERVITLDTHVDINPSNFTAERNYTQDLSNQVTLPKMFGGGLDAAFLIVYVGQNRTADAFTKPAFDAAYRQAIEKFDAIHRLTKEIAPDRIELALTPADVRRIDAAGRKVALIGVENGYSLGDETTAVARVQEFYDRGARYLSLAHNGHSQLADSNTGEADGVWRHQGLSPLGRQVIAALNEAGILVDISHPSKAANLQAMALSKVPVIASHSGARAVQDHSRNLDDEQLLALKKNGGVAQAVALGTYVKVYPPSAGADRGARSAGRRVQGPGRGPRAWRRRPGHRARDADAATRASRH